LLQVEIFYENKREFMRIDGAADTAKIAAFHRQACLASVTCLRDFWRNMGFVNLIDQERAELGRKVSDGLYRVMEFGIESLEELVTPKREFTRICDPQRVTELLAALEDPVVDGLWELNTVQAMLDLLAHNGLHLWDRHYLLESTLDYAMQRKVSVSPADLGERGAPFSDFDDALTKKVAGALKLAHVKGVQYRNRTGVISFLPLQDTSQAQQLAKVLNIGISTADGLVTAVSIDRPHLVRQELLASHSDNPEAATRRAIVMVAANIIDGQYLSAAA
jgi:hypothetical protein